MDSKFILENFRRQLQEEVDYRRKFKKVMLCVLLSALFFIFIYIVAKQISFAKYFFFIVTTKDSYTYTLNPNLSCSENINLKTKNKPYYLGNSIILTGCLEE